MKTIAFSLLFALCSLLSEAQTPQLFNADLRSVTVYRTGAELNHTVAVNIPAGSSEIVIANIANNIEQNSIQLNTPANVTILSTTFSRDYLKHINRSPAYLKVEDSLTQAKAALSAIQNRKTVEENLLEVLDKNQVSGGTSSGTNIVELAKLMDYHKSKRLEIRTNIVALQLQETKQQDRITKLQQQLSELGASQSGIKGQLVLQLNSSAPINGAIFTLSYLSTSASWAPFYDLRGESLASPLKIIYKANVAQSTGIDWKKVKLSLSTGSPTQNGTAPILSTWFLRYGTAYAVSNAAVSNSTQSLESRAPMRVAAAKVEDVRDQNIATQSENALNTSFDIDMPYDIASNNKAHAVVLNTFTQPVLYKYYSVPKLDKDVFLLAEITDYEKLNLLPGEANIIFENTYVGKTTINPNATTDTINLSMGRDRKIIVKREKVVEQNAVKTIGGSKKQNFTFEITLRNTKSESINLLLKDQIPVSTDKSIEVELINSGGAVVNAETGVLTWKLTIPPGTTQKYRFSYSVKYPKDQSIANL